MAWPRWLHFILLACQVSFGKAKRILGLVLTDILLQSSMTSCHLKRMSSFVGLVSSLESATVWYVQMLLFLPSPSTCLMLWFLFCKPDHLLFSPSSMLHSPET